MIPVRRLGRTSVEVTTLGLGTAPLGELFEPVSEAQSLATIDAAWRAGIRYFDTSPFYGHGKSELRVGRGLEGHERGAFVTSTKVGRLMRRPADPNSFRPEFWHGALPLRAHFDYSYDGIMRSVEDSYLRLGMNRIDLLVIHDLDTWFHPHPERLTAFRGQLISSGWRALEDLRAGGVIGGIGAGINERGMMGWFLDHMPIDFFLLALRYTLIEQDVLEDELPRCSEAGVGLIIGGVFNSGILAQGARPGVKYNYVDALPEILDRVARMERVCAAHGVKLPAAALQFPLAHPLVASVIPGAQSPEHVEMNLRAFAEPIPDSFWSDLKNEGLLRSDAPVPA
jgi:D-threo-aldose 1-dehydrogenase